MRHTLTSFPLLGPCLPIIGFRELADFHMNPGQSTDRTGWLLRMGQAPDSLLRAWFEQRLLFIYFRSAALAAADTSYSRLGFGLPGRTRWLQAFAAGQRSLPFDVLFSDVRAREEVTESFARQVGL
jgi:hypothetical protein